ncbi:hypothetical protein [Persicitalea sp.]
MIRAAAGIEGYNPAGRGNVQDGLADRVGWELHLLFVTALEFLITTLIS